MASLPAYLPGHLCMLFLLTTQDGSVLPLLNRDRKCTWESAKQVHIVHCCGTSSSGFQGSSFTVTVRHKITLFRQASKMGYHLKDKKQNKKNPPEILWAWLKPLAWVLSGVDVMRSQEWTSLLLYLQGTQVLKHCWGEEGPQGWNCTIWFLSDPC